VAYREIKVEIYINITPLCKPCYTGFDDYFDFISLAGIFKPYVLVCGFVLFKQSLMRFPQVSNVSYIFLNVP